MLLKYSNTIKKEIKSHTTFYILLSAIFFLAFFLRVYRLNDLMGFYYDQGRDALVIWRLLYEGKLFLVGPVTGLAGIFLGPLYYYLIAPFYFLGGGNPLYPAVLLALLATLAIVVVYILGYKIHSKLAGLVAVVIASFSFYIVQAGRWLSNPTPILLTSVLLFWMMWEIVNQSKSKRINMLWIAVSVLVGVSLQFESASAVFYLPIIFVFALWQRRKLPSIKYIFLSFFIFFVTLLPQIAFNFRHDNLLLKSFQRVLITEQSFKLSFWDVLMTRLEYFWTVFYSKIIPEKSLSVAVFTLMSLFSLLSTENKVVKTKVLPLFSIFLMTPMLFYILFQGNFGNIFDYYMSGYYLPMILLFSIGLIEAWKSSLGKIVMVVFLYLFLTTNLSMLKNHLTSGVNGPEAITLVNQITAVDYVLQKGKEHKEFNVDFYVPPVIPHAYDYLFLWRGNILCGDNLCGLQLNKQVDVIYTPYEVDSTHPHRLGAWLERQDKVGVVEEEKRFGGIVVQRRKRLQN
jgi:4-amino-4-deoxy-L-arabinose transferase-like glycosyltransferase